MHELLNGKKEEEEKNELILFKANVDRFMDLEGGNLGPFEKGQMANIPKTIAKILVDDGKADVVEK